jgi:ribosomally synthesized peptide (two-chain TOMM family)
MATIDGTKKQLKGWKNVWLKAIALSWRNPEFKQELIENPRIALAQHFGYTLPNYIDLTVFEANDPQNHTPVTQVNDGRRTDAEHENVKERSAHREYGYHPEEGGSPWVMPNNQINLPLPPPPANLKDQAIALASFSNSNSYPFSTC